jgi:hypothetical protein
MPPKKQSARQIALARDPTFKPALQADLNSFVAGTRDKVTNSHRLQARVHLFEAGYRKEINYTGEGWTPVSLNALVEYVGDFCGDNVTCVQPGGPRQPVFWVATELLADVCILGIKQGRHTTKTYQKEQVAIPPVVHNLVSSVFVMCRLSKSRSSEGTVQGRVLQRRPFVRNSSTATTFTSSVLSVWVRT